MKKQFKSIIKSNKFSYSIAISILKLFKNNKQTQYFTNIFSNVVNGSLVLTLKNIPGEHEIGVHSHLLKRILITKEYEPDITKLIKSNINSEKDAINIGANIGLFTNLIASKINKDHKVLAIEPTEGAYKLLASNIKRNENSSKVITFNGIASERSGNFVLNVIPGNEEYSSLGELISPSTKNLTSLKVEIKGETIDNLVNKYNINPGLLVIDVEGAEHSVLKGAINTIKKHKPIIISEIDDKFLIKQNSSSKQVIDFLEGMGYKVVDTNSNIIQYPFTGNIIAVFK